MREADETLLRGLIETCRDVIVAHADALCTLDRAIGDGDHGTNLQRGLEAVYAERDNVSALPLAEALERIGTVLVMTVGGAAGPLYGTLLIAFGRALRAKDIEVRVTAPSDTGRTGMQTDAISTGDIADAFRQAIEAVARRGRAIPGDKTLLDVLYPISAAVSERATLTTISRRATRSAELTAPMQARRGRAAWLGERSVGHVDPGASSCALMTVAICRYLEVHHGKSGFAEEMNRNRKRETVLGSQWI